MPATSEQAVVLDGEHAVVTICSTCGVSETLSDADRQRFLAPNPWVQSDASVVRAFAKRSAGAGTPDQKMSRLVRGVIDHMTGKVDYLGYATARAKFGRGEIRVLDHDVKVQTIIPLNKSPEAIEA